MTGLNILQHSNVKDVEVGTGHLEN